MPPVISAGALVVAGTYLNQAVFRRVQGVGLATGDNDLYTVPTGKRAYNNGSVGTITRFAQVKIAGTYYRLITSTTTNVNAAASTYQGLVFEAGDIFSMNVTVNGGLNVSAEVVEFDATSPLKSARLVGLSTGDNTLYTCPAGKTAYLASTIGAYFGNFTANRITLISDSGGNRVWFAHLVPSGQAVGATYRLTPSTTVNSNASGSLSFMAQFAPGDFLNINVDTGAATQLAWGNIIEI